MSDLSHGHAKLDERTARLTRFSLQRRITILVMLVTTLVVGGIAAVSIPLELIPKGFEDPYLGVTVPWRDAPAPEVQEKITLPLEEELSTVRGLDRLNSYSMTGRARLWLNFKQGTDMDVAYREVRDRIERTRGEFPDDADRYFIRKHDDTGIPVAVYGLAVDPSLTDIYNLVENQVRLRFERIDGVAAVEIEGLEEKEILIELDRKKTEAAGLNIYEMAQELGSDNFTMASGDVFDGDRKLLLRSVARYDSLEALEHRLVSDNIRLKDVATVSYDEPEKRYRVRVNSRPAYAVVVMKEGQANTMAVSQRLEEEFARMQKNPRLQKVQMVTLFNQGNVINESLDTLLTSGKIGAAFAVMVLFVFLRRFRMTAIITLSIPLSIVVGLTVMYFAGESLNILTLLGLMICVGLLVDNSVVVAENIHRLHRLGLDRRTACVRGASEIALAIVTATLTTIVVFLPVALVDGQGQFFLIRLAMPIGVSLTASLLVALVFVPLAVYLTLPNGGARREASWLKRTHSVADVWLTRAYDATPERINRGYLVFLRFFLHRRVDLVIVLGGVFLVTMGVAGERELKVTEQQENEKSGFEIDIEFPRTWTLTDAEAYFSECEKVLEEGQHDWDLQGYILVHTKRWGEIEGWFNNPRQDEDLTPREVTKLVLDKLPKKPGVTFYTGTESEVDDEDGEATWVVALQGDDWQSLEEVATGLERYLETLPGVLGRKRQSNRQTDELALVIDRDRTQRHGVNPQVVAGVVGYALRGTSLPRYHKDGREIPVRIRFQESDREGLNELASFAVPTASGDALPLSSVTSAEELPSYRGILRRGKRVTRTITLELEEETQKETRKLLSAVTASLDLPEGMSVGASRSRQSFDEDLKAMQFAGILSVVFIYLLMGVLFESFILPLSILFTIPLASIGVVWTHVVSGLDIDFLGVVGGILLVGVVVNNGIVLVDYLNRLRWQGHGRDEAVLLAAERRFRPIMMTALTTIIGMIPLTVGGTSSIGWSYTSFGMTLIGGMSTATLLTLLVVPVFYTLFDDAREWLSGLVANALRGVRARRVAGAGSPTATS